VTDKTQPFHVLLLKGSDKKYLIMRRGTTKDTADIETIEALVGNYFVTKL
jgi:hypothetical protein